MDKTKIKKIRRNIINTAMENYLALKLLNGTGDIIIVCDEKARIYWCNRAWSELSGWAEQETVNYEFVDLVHPEDVEAVRGRYDVAVHRNACPIAHSDVFLARIKIKGGGFRNIEFNANRMKTLDNYTMLIGRPVLFRNKRIYVDYESTNETTIKTRLIGSEKSQKIRTGSSWWNYSDSVSFKDIGEKKDKGVSWAFKVKDMLSLRSHDKNLTVTITKGSGIVNIRKWWGFKKMNIKIGSSFYVPANSFYSISGECGGIMVWV